NGDLAHEGFRRRRERMRRLALLHVRRVAGARLARAPAEPAGRVAARLDAAALDRLVLPDDGLDLLLLRLLLGLLRLALALPFRLVRRALGGRRRRCCRRLRRLRLLGRRFPLGRRGLGVLLAALLLRVLGLARRELGLAPRFGLAQRYLLGVDDRLDGLNFG